MKVLVPVKRVVDYNVKVRVKSDGSGVDLAALSWNVALNEARASAARYYLEEVLRRHDGNVASAAAHAGVERESYYRLVRRFGAKLKDDEGRASSPPPSDSNTPLPDETR